MGFIMKVRRRRPVIEMLSSTSSVVRSVGTSVVTFRGRGVKKMAHRYYLVAGYLFVDTFHQFLMIRSFTCFLPNNTRMI